MRAHQRTAPAPGPDLLARYLNAYWHARSTSSVERPWGLGEESLDVLWTRLIEALATNPQRLGKVVAEDLNDTERAAIAETLAPLIFALPLRAYPAELRGTTAGGRLTLVLRHLGTRTTPPESAPAQQACPGYFSAAPASKAGEKSGIEFIGHLPAVLTSALGDYLRRVLRWPHDRKAGVAVISSGGRRRRVRIRLLVRDRGLVIRFLERLPSPADS